MGRTRRVVLQNKVKAKELYNQGYTLQEIADKLGYKSRAWVLEMIDDQGLEVKGYLKDGRIEWL